MRGHYNVKLATSVDNQSDIQMYFTHHSDLFWLPHHSHHQAIHRHYKKEIQLAHFATEVSLFVNIIPKYNYRLSHLSMSWEVL
jgi:hypothetical protein